MVATDTALLSANQSVNQPNINFSHMLGHHIRPINPLTADSVKALHFAILV